MNRRVGIIFIFLLLTGCSVKNIPDYTYTEKKSYQSHQRQYNFDQRLHQHHDNINELQGEVNQLMDDMDGGGNSSSSYNQSFSYSQKNNSYDLEDMCNDVYIRYVKLLNQGADRGVVSRAYRRYKQCDDKKRSLQR